MSTISTMLDEVVAMNKNAWRIARFRRESGAQASILPAEEKAQELTQEELLKKVESSLSKVIVKAGAVEDLLKTSKNEGFLKLGRLWCVALGIHLPCWPCHALGPGLPADEMKR